MKLTFVLMMVAFLQVSAASYAQKISLTVKDALLKDVFKDLRKQSGYNFLYDSDMLGEAKPVTISVVNMPLKDVLEACFKSQPVTYVIDQNTVVVKLKPIPVIQKSVNDIIQNTTVTGKVTDSKGQPLPGVSVKLKGTSTGTVTNAEGNYSVTFSNENGTLVFSYLGFLNKEVAINSLATINVVLEEADQSLNEVVVIGYGTKKKADLTGTVNSVSGKVIAESKAPNAQEALQGRVAGVDIIRNSSKPGSDFSIIIRGQNSINANVQPLYVVDGIPVVNNATNGINDINPADIERIDILKDASSTAIYGSRGANGVVLVTTKRGTKGATKINYDAYVGIVNAYNLPPMMNGPQFVDYARDFYNEQAQASALLNNQPLPTTPIPDNKIFSPTELSNIANGTYTNWVNLIKQNGLQTNHNLSITGGDDKTLYFVSAGYQDYQGATKTENTQKFTLKVGLDKTLNNTFKFGASLYGVYANINPGGGEAFRSAYRLRPTGSATNADGTPRFITSEAESQITNPLFDFMNEVSSQQYIRLLPNLYGEVTFIKGLTFKSTFTPDITFQRTGTYDGQFTKVNAGTKPASAQNGHNDFFNYTFDNLLSYNKEIGKSKFDVTLGSSTDYYQYDFSLIGVTGLPFKSLWYNVGTAVPITINGNTIQPTTSVSSGYSKQNIQSYFGRVNYTFNNRYLFTATLRGDGNSIFAPGHKWGYFPSAAFAWRISEEDFLKNVSWISNMKLRLSTGKAGNAAISGPIQPYFSQSTITGTQYNFGGSNANGFAPALLANQDLTWEKTTEYDAGLDLDVFQGRISMQLDYYNKTAHGLLGTELLPPEDPFGSVVANLGTVRNQGIEVSISSTNIRTKDFTWSSNINFSKNKNTLLNIYGPGNNTNNVGQQQFIGHPVSVVYAYKIIGVWQQSEAAQAAKYGQIPGQYKIQDITNSGLNTGTPTAANFSPDGVINPTTDRQIIGSSIPKWFGGITNSFKYKNFDFNIVVYTRQGTFQQSTFLVQYLDGDQGRARFNAFNRSYWTPTNPSNTWANQGRQVDGNAKGISEYSNSSYTKISNMTLGYTLSPKTVQSIGIKSLRVYVDAFNPFIFTKFVGWDPENPSGNSFGNADFRTRTFILGVNVSL